MRNTAFSLALFLALCAAGCERKPPLPADLRQIHCRESDRGGNPKYPVASEGYAVFRAAGTVLAMPCMKQGKAKELENDWKQQHERNNPVHIDALRFLKTPKGRFEVSDDVHLIPYASWARYALVSYLSIQPNEWKGPFTFRKEIRYYWEMKVRTPAAFAATGPETTFRCHGPELMATFVVADCLTQVRSNSLYWTIAVSFGKPYPDTADTMQAEVTEAYNLLAAHFIKQD